MKRYWKRFQALPFSKKVCFIIVAPIVGPMLLLGIVASKAADCIADVLD